MKSAFIMKTSLKNIRKTVVSDKCTHENKKSLQSPSQFRVTHISIVLLSYRFGYVFMVDGYKRKAETFSDGFGPRQFYWWPTEYLFTKLNYICNKWKSRFHHVTEWIEQRCFDLRQIIGMHVGCKLQRTTGSSFL